MVRKPATAVRLDQRAKGGRLKCAAQYTDSLALADDLQRKWDNR